MPQRELARGPKGRGLPLDTITALEPEKAGDATALAAGAVLLRGFAQSVLPDLERCVGSIALRAPFRYMTTPGGRVMSVAMTNCGPLGWVSDRAGYRYAPRDPVDHRPWPPMPAGFVAVARTAADAAGYPAFVPDACLLNRYEPGTRLSLHQDRDERDFDAPIVSVSLGLPARFLFGGPARRDPVRSVTLEEGDVVVFGGTARLHFHGVAPLPKGEHPRLGGCRVNLTFRKAG